MYKQYLRTKQLEFKGLGTFIYKIELLESDLYKFDLNHLSFKNDLKIGETEIKVIRIGDLFKEHDLFFDFKKSNEFDSLIILKRTLHHDTINNCIICNKRQMKFIINLSLKNKNTNWYILKNDKKSYELMKSIKSHFDSRFYNRHYYDKSLSDLLDNNDSVKFIYDKYLLESIINDIHFILSELKQHDEFKELVHSKSDNKHFEIIKGAFYDYSFKLFCFLRFKGLNDKMLNNFDNERNCLYELETVIKAQIDLITEENNSLSPKSYLDDYELYKINLKDYFINP